MGARERKKLDLESKVDCLVLTYSLCVVAYPNSVKDMELLH